MQVFGKDGAVIDQTSREERISHKKYKAPLNASEYMDGSEKAYKSQNENFNKKSWYK